MEQERHIYFGWDVGAWNCDRNSRSRDAIVVLDDALTLIGKPWRGNLRETINGATNGRHFKAEIARLCAADEIANAERIVIAIDAPLGFPDALVSLASHLLSVPEIGSFGDNPYLFRQTEKYLRARGFKPLSAINDMIGSQATKARHFLSKLAPNTIGYGVWTDNDGLSAIEAYPACCQDSAVVHAARTQVGMVSENNDIQDALTCAVVAYLFDAKRDALVSPSSDIPNSEGWIWVPKDIFSDEGEESD